MSDADVIATPDSFAELVDVLEFLERTGWKVTRSTIFNHQKGGKIVRDKENGRFLLSAVEKYAAKHLKRADTGTNPKDDWEKYNDRKLKSEVRLKEAQARRAELDLDVALGKYIDREEMERELVGRALVLDSSLRHLMKTFAPEWIDLVAGDQKKIGELRDAMMEALDQCMNSFASTHDFVVELRSDYQEPAA